MVKGNWTRLRYFFSMSRLLWKGAKRCGKNILRFRFSAFSSINLSYRKALNRCLVCCSFSNKHLTWKGTKLINEISDMDITHRKRDSRLKFFSFGGRCVWSVCVRRFPRIRLRRSKFFDILGRTWWVVVCVENHTNLFRYRIQSEREESAFFFFFLPFSRVPY